MFTQTPTDAAMMDKGQICFGAVYSNNAWNKYWEGQLLRDNGNIGTLSTQAFSAGFAYGITKKINLIASFPYLKTEPSAGTVIGSKGFQDASVNLKAKLLEKNLHKGKLNIFTNAGISFPLSDYFPEEPFAIGFGCMDAGLRAIMYYEHEKGLYSKLTGAYHLRGATFINPTYYYTTYAISTNEVDMPNASDYSLAIGGFTHDKQLKAEAEFSSFTTFNGFDIRRQDGGFPSNDIEALRIGINADYFPAYFSGFTVHAFSAYTLHGRNIGKSFMYGVGVSYAFMIWQKNNTEQSTM